MLCVHYVTGVIVDPLCVFVCIIVICYYCYIQASCDDPPFLNVGTEVSAKYRGAFCEATIKIAKKVVKCKVGQYTLCVIC